MLHNVGPAKRQLGSAGSFREVSGYDSDVSLPVQQAQKLSLMPQGNLILSAFIPGEAPDINLQK